MKTEFSIGTSVLAYTTLASVSNNGITYLIKVSLCTWRHHQHTHNGLS